MGLMMDARGPIEVAIYLHGRAHAVNRSKSEQKSKKLREKA